MVADASSTTLLCILSSFARNFPARYLDGEFERKREKRFDIKFERERETPEEQWKDIGRCVGAKASGTMARYHRQVAGFQRHTLESLPGLKTFFWNSFYATKERFTRGIVA